jgi:hypothetical protein
LRPKLKNAARSSITFGQATGLLSASKLPFTNLNLSEHYNQVVDDDDSWMMRLLLLLLLLMMMMTTTNMTTIMIMIHPRILTPFHQGQIVSGTKHV